MARDNPGWGCVRIQGELIKLGFRVSATAIRKLLRTNRIGPAPLRSRLSWKKFLQAQASAILVSDFFSVDKVILKRLYVLLYMELASRRVIRIAVTDRPDAAWVTPQARNLVFELEEHGLQVRFLIHDHDNKFGGGSDLVFQARVLGLAPGCEPDPPGACPRGVDRALQPSPSASGDWASNADRPLRSGACLRAGPVPLEVRRTAA